MRFRILTLFPYGERDNDRSVYKLFLVEDVHQYFLQGYLIQELNKKKFLINPKLNDLSDYSVIDTNDNNKMFVFDDEGEYKIKIANDTVEGLPKLLDATVNLALNTPYQYSLGEAVEVFKSRLEPIYEADEAIGENIFLYIITQYERDLPYLTYTAPQGYLTEKLYSFLRTKAICEMLGIEGELKTIYETSINILHMNYPNEIAKVIKFLKLAKQNNLNVKYLTIPDLREIYKRINYLTKKALKEYIESIYKESQAEFEFSCTLPAEKNKQSLIKALNQIVKISRIVVYKNSQEALDVQLNIPLFAAEIQQDIDRSGIFFLSDKDVDMLIDFKRNYLSIKSNNFEYSTRIEVIDNKVKCTDKNLFKFKLFNKGIK